MLLPLLILFLLLRNSGLQPQFYRSPLQLQLQYPLYTSFLQENLSNVLFKILNSYYSRKFLFLLDLPTIQKLMIHFSYHRLIKMVVNFQRQLTFGLVKTSVAKTHMYCVFTKYCVFNCAPHFCRTYLTCCSYCGVKSCSFCLDNCSDCASRNIFF